MPPKERDIITPTLLKRMLSFANRHHATGNVLHAMETWIDDLAIPGYRWAQRDHPEYQLSFTKQVRGQDLRTYVDYNAGSDFLALFMYLPAPFEPDARAGVCEIINKVNFDAPYGNLELDPSRGKLRFRLSIDVEGIRLTHAFLDFMLSSGCEVFHKYLPVLLPRPKELAR